MHILPQLRKLEQRYPEELTVIGVHSAKFPTERETESIRQAVLRYRVEHPVVNDRDFLIWQQYGCRAWPTLMFIDPQGNVIGKHEGELPFEVMDRLMREMVQEFEAKGLLERRVLRFQQPQSVRTPLYFPGKVLADPSSRQLFIADSNHHRIVVATLDGLVREVIGSGGPGLQDGPFAAAQFHQPQGLALAGDVLYVADTENHAIRRVDLARRTVETIAGTGAQGHGYDGGGPARSTALSSPWDVALVGDLLYIAMAGLHQIWALDLASGIVGPVIGNGREGLADGPLAEAMLAQTSGLAFHDGRLYFADSETSSIRYADFATHTVHTIVGQDLFVFGDVDGIGDRVRLQHPLGVCVGEGPDVLYIADSYNHKIKRIAVSSRACTTLAGTGEAGLTDGPLQTARFHEPGGLSLAEGRLYVADTNNHAIRVIDLRAGQVSTLNVQGL